MGVPGFYRWVVQRYPLIRHRMDDPAKPVINNFFIDFNCIIYNAIRLLNSDDPDFMIHMQNEICRYLDTLVQTVRPDTLIYIAVDGPAPFAKCTQQRSRRFFAARDKKSDGFDTTTISVGTEFMEVLNQHLQDYFKVKIATDPTWQKPKVVYSSYLTPGEGEHKFFEYLRLHPDPMATSIVYSPDADLIFLGLMTGIKHFYIMREWDAWMGPRDNAGSGHYNKLRTSPADFEIIHLPLLREYLMFDFGSDDIEKLIADFNAFSFLLGNDFIPHFPDVHISHGDFEVVVEAYRESLYQKGKHLVEDGHFSKQGLKEFIDLLCNNLSNRQQPQRSREQSSAETSSEVITTDKSDSEKSDAGIRESNLIKGRKYLRDKYGDLMDKPGFEEELCHNVLESFEWVLAYYTKGCPSWTWFFRFHYAPPLAVVAEHINTFEPHFELDRPPTPMEQLLCIMPPQAAHLLPKPLAALMSAPSPIAEFYPTTFEIDLNGGKFEREGVIKIPFPDLQMIRAEASKVIELIDQKEQQRNRSLPPSLVALPDLVPIGVDFEAPRQSVPDGIATFSNALHKVETKRCRIPVNVFNRPSDHDSISIKLDVEYNLEDAKRLLGEMVYVDWPFLRPARVVCVYTKEEGFQIDSNKEITAFQADDRTISDSVQFNRQKRGVNVGGCKVWVGAHPLRFASIDETAFEYMERLCCIPLDLVVPMTEENTPHRFSTMRHPEPKLIEGMPVVSKTSGRRGICRKIGDSIIIELYENSVVELSDLISEDEKEWLKVNDVAEEYEISGGAFSCFLSTLKAKRIDDDVALTLFFGRNAVEGYARKVGGVQEMTRMAKDAVDRYFEMAPPFKEFIKTLKGAARFVTLENFVEGENDEERLAKAREIVNFVNKESPAARNFLMDIGLKTVSQATLEACEERLIAAPSVSHAPVSEIEIAADDLLWPGCHSEGKPVEVGQRVVSLQPCGSVPFGTAGTVVAYDAERREAHVLADEELTFGTNLRKRLKTNRGFVAKVSDLWVPLA